MFDADPRLTGLVYQPQNFRDLAESPVGYEIWPWLIRADNVVRMETASYLERAAVEPLGPTLVADFGEPVADDRHKQMIGHMVRQIMEELGYELVQQGVRITKGLFTTGARYQREEEKRDRTMRITREQRQAWLERTAKSPFNVWLDEQVRDSSGKLDKEKLYAVAQHYGITDCEAYKHLNPGQQRMTIGIKLRGKVPAADYAKAA